MKKEISNEKNENGLYSKTTVKEKTPEDGFIFENKEPIASTWSETNQPGHYEWHKGYAKKISYTTNDPRITRPFAYTACGIFLTIGIILFLFRSWFFGIIFTSTALLAFFNSKKDIDTIEEDFKKQGHDMDSDEEKEKVRKEFTETLKNGCDDVKTSTFTKNNFNNFAKKTIPLYFVISVIISLLITLAINVVLGLVVFGICILVGLLYYYIVSKICKY